MKPVNSNSTNIRIRGLYGFILVLCVIFGLRLFYIQIIKHDYYKTLAEQSQQRSYNIPAERGAILAKDGDEAVPVVLNEIQYRIVADPQIIDEKQDVAYRVADVLGVDGDEILKQLEVEDLRYVILAKKQSKEVKEEIERLYQEGEIVGVFAERTIHRVYPQGALAAQLLGFVDDENEGRYGVEEYFEDVLDGEEGRLRALTDQNGVPLLATGDNIQIDPVDGEDITLTIDIAMQRQMEKILEDGVKAAKSESGSAIIIDPNSGAIKAMANYPSYDPAKFDEVEDPLLFTNPVVSSPLEPGSVMKPLTVAAALNTGSVGPNDSYYDPGFYIIDEAKVENVIEVSGAYDRTISDVLLRSLNTGATYLLMQMGGGEVNQQARETWHDYMVNHYMFGKKTGIEQGFEEPGSIPDPNDGFGLNIQYANTSFGQGMSLTLIQMASAISAAVNGGTYYQPHLVESHGSGEDQQVTERKVLKSDVVSKQTSSDLRAMMENVINRNLPTASREGYSVGGKTGTAEIARPEGGYYENRFNGTYVGYVGGNLPEYVVMVRVNDPGIPGYAGSQAAGPVFSDIINMLIDNFSVTSQT